MRWKGPLTFRHLLVAVLVMILVNAQLTWWLLFALRQSRDRLDLERQHLVELAQHHVLRIESALLEAEVGLLQSLAQPGFSPADLPRPFISVAPTIDSKCHSHWKNNGFDLSYVTQGLEECLQITPDSEWVNSLIDVGASLEIVPIGITREEAQTRTPMPQLELSHPFDAQVIRPQRQAWDEILETYRSRIVMMVSEGSFFAIMLLVLIGLLWKTMRREVELERRHRNFLSAITHELKSPLAAVRLSLETVLRGRADKAAGIRFLENALHDTERLQSLVQKVLEVTRFSGGDSNIRLRNANLSQVVEEAVDAFSRHTSAAGVRLDTHIQPDIRAKVDLEAFPIAISNLLENALKYGGNRPQITVRLDHADGKAILDVTDNGAGIASQEAQFIFERFYRCGDEMTRTTQGTGLGLFLVQEIVTSHSGSVVIAETGPSGTTFRVTLDEVGRWEETR